MGFIRFDSIRALGFYGLLSSSFRKRCRIPWLIPTREGLALMVLDLEGFENPEAR
jgi:hypothetical protein